jgi:excisionase family DNA binding protein
MDTAMPKTTNPPSDGYSSPVIPASRLAYGIENAADALNLSRSRIYELIAAGEILVCKVGKRTIIPAAELTAFLERHLVERFSDRRPVLAPPPRSGPKPKPGR